MWYMWMRNSAGSCIKGKISFGPRRALSVGSEGWDSVNELGSGVARPLRIVVKDCPMCVSQPRQALASLFSFNLLDARGGSACSGCSAAALWRVRLPNAFPLAGSAMLFALNRSSRVPIHMHVMFRYADPCGCCALRMIDR